MLPALLERNVVALSLRERRAASSPKIPPRATSLGPPRTPYVKALYDTARMSPLLKAGPCGRREGREESPVTRLQGGADPARGGDGGPPNRAWQGASGDSKGAAPGPQTPLLGTRRSCLPAQIQHGLSVANLPGALQHGCHLAGGIVNKRSFFANVYGTRSGGAGEFVFRRNTREVIGTLTNSRGCRGKTDSVPALEG